MLKDRIALADSMKDYVGKYFSHTYVRKNILKQSDRDIEEIDNQITEEGSDMDNVDTQNTDKPESLV